MRKSTQTKACLTSLDSQARRQGLLFDGERAAAARDQAISTVADNAKPDHRAALSAAIMATARQLATFTTDDVWSRVSGEIREAIEPRLIGALMIEAAKQGHIERLDGVYRASDMVRCHHRPKQVWRSLVLGTYQ